MIEYRYPDLEEEVEDALHRLKYGAASGHLGADDLKAYSVVKRWLDRLELEIVLCAVDGEGLSWQQLGEEMVKAGLVDEPASRQQSKSSRSLSQRQRIALANKVRNKYAVRRTAAERQRYGLSKLDYWRGMQQQAVREMQARYASVQEP
jgi:hypothetical protein